MLGLLVNGVEDDLTVCLLSTFYDEGITARLPD